MHEITGILYVQYMCLLCVDMLLIYIAIFTFYTLFLNL